MRPLEEQKNMINETILDSSTYLSLNASEYEIISRNIRFHAADLKPQIIECLDMRSMVKACFEWCQEQHIIAHLNYATELLYLVAFGVVILILHSIIVNKPHWFKDAKSHDYVIYYTFWIPIILFIAYLIIKLWFPQGV